MPSAASQQRAASRIKATLKEPTHSHPLLAAMQFAHLTNTAGGATQYLRSGKIFPAGAPGYIVGGERDNAGKPVATNPIHGQMTPDQALDERLRLSVRARDQGHAMGSWRDTEIPNAPAEIDLSHIYSDRRRALNVASARGEKAIWDNANMADIRLDK